MASAVEPVDRFRCVHEQVHLDVDIYATGHPMGGIGMYSGFMEVQFTESGLREVIHFQARTSERKTDAYKISGESPDIQNNEYTVYFRELPGLSKVTKADLRIQEIRPFPGAVEEVLGLDCVIKQKY